MKKMISVTDARFVTALRQMRRHMTLREIGVALDASPETVRLWLMKDGTAPQPRFRRRMAEYLDALDGGGK